MSKGTYLLEFTVRIVEQLSKGQGHRLLSYYSIKMQSISLQVLIHLMVFPSLWKPNLLPGPFLDCI